MHVAMQIQELTPWHIDHDLLQQACELLCRVWPKPGRTPQSRLQSALEEFAAYAGPAGPHPRSLVVQEEGRVIAHAAITPREIDLAGRRVIVAGLAKVCTALEIRGRGLGNLVVRAAFESVDRGDFAWSLFQTTPEVRPFYERLGAVAIDNRIVNSLADDPEARPFWDEAAMRYPDREGWPAGKIDLLGPGY